ncbi:MAG TPA: GNAT family N-acetyltransferase [Pirellulales bacterium]|jgi:ribosomal protein S18 acetylase RimI-like enzyme
MSQATTTNGMRRLEPSDFPRAKALLGCAFYDYNLMVYSQPKDHRRLRAVADLYGAMLWDCMCRGQAYATLDFSGITAWLRPGTDIPSFWQQVRSGMLRLLPGFGLRGFRRLIDYDEVGRRMHHQYAHKSHWYLAAIAVDPDHQGRGIGSNLMTPILERADAEGVPCWLDTHQEQNVRLYQRHGFQVAECTAPRGHQIPVYGMVRPPRSRS